MELVDMMHFIVTLCLYYILFIISVFLHRHFSKFIASDFKNNRSLNIKRRWVLTYYYFSGVIYNAYLVNLLGKGNLGTLSNSSYIIFIGISIFLIILWYCHIICSLEAPKKLHKKRRWK